MRRVMKRPNDGVSYCTVELYCTSVVLQSWYGQFNTRVVARPRRHARSTGVALPFCSIYHDANYKKCVLPRYE